MVPAAPGRLCLAGGTVVLSALLLQGCIPKPPPPCSTEVENCIKTGCCTDKSLTCYARDAAWASCKSSCSTSFGHACEKVGKGGKVTFRTTTQAPVVEEPVAAHVDDFKWIEGTWTTGYWDCCKPSCSWPGKGSVNQTVAACSASTGAVLSDQNTASVCDGGDAGTCANNLPFQVSEGLSMGFAAAAVGGISGLNGDANCGQCFELVFTDQEHVDASGYPWGGAHPDLVSKKHIVQVTNIGYDVSGEHSFDLMIPGAGQGQFTNGCSRQFPSRSSGDFDCDNNWGGCKERSGCERLPQELRAGCYWRYDWYRWLTSSGKTNNPFVKFRRVKCPDQLIAITGSVPLDDGSYPDSSTPFDVISGAWGQHIGSYVLIVGFATATVMVSL